MKYEEPTITIIPLEMEDIVCLSVESGGSGDNVTGGWSS